MLCVDITMLIAAAPSPVIAGHKHTPVEIHILINNMCVSTQPQTPGKDNNYPDKECLVLISVCISTTTAMSAPPAPAETGLHVELLEKQERTYSVDI